MDDADFPQAQCDLMLLDPTFFDRPADFRTLYSASTGHLLLLERRDPLQLGALLDTNLTHASSNDEFVSLWSPDIKPFFGKELLLEIDATITSTARPLTAQLIIEVKDGSGEHLHYRGFGLERRRAEWDGDTMHVCLRVPRIAPKTASAGLYPLEPAPTGNVLDRVRLRVLELKPLK
jgi:hypothetical protein